jgi:type IV secretion system protein VirB8
MNAVKAEDKERYLESARTGNMTGCARRSSRGALPGWWRAAPVCWRLYRSARSHCSPLKTVVPYVIRVDRSTGETEIVTALKGPQPRTYDDAVNRYFIAQYVRLREGWLNDAARENAYTVMLMSEQAEAGRYLASVESSNKNAPSNIYGDGGFVSITIRSISYLSPTVAQVRFSKSSRWARTRRRAELERHPHLQIQRCARAREGSRHQSARLSGRELPQRSGGLT